MLKQIQVQLYPPKQSYWHGDIKKHWCSSDVFIVNFEKIPHLFLAFHCWIQESVAVCVCQQRSKYRQVKITKHASTGTHDATLTKWVKEQPEKKPVPNLKSMQIVSFEQTSTKLFRFLFCKNNFFVGEKTVLGTG